MLCERVVAKIYDQIDLFRHLCCKEFAEDINAKPNFYYKSQSCFYVFCQRFIIFFSLYFTLVVCAMYKETLRWISSTWHLPVVDTLRFAAFFIESKQTRTRTHFWFRWQFIFLCGFISQKHRQNEFWWCLKWKRKIFWKSNNERKLKIDFIIISCPSDKFAVLFEWKTLLCSQHKTEKSAKVATVHVFYVL